MQGDNNIPPGLNIGDHNLRNNPVRQEAQAQQFRPVLQGIPLAEPVVNQPPPPEYDDLDQANNDIQNEPQQGEHPEINPEPPIQPQINQIQPQVNLNQPQFNMAHQIEAKYPPTFSGKAGEDVKNFIQKFKIYAQIKDINEDLAMVKFHFGQFLADGPCTQWWADHQDANEAIPDMQTYLTAFHSHFDRPAPTFNVLEEIRERKYLPTDTIETYADSIQKLCNKIRMTEVETINSFILGLPTAIRGTVAALNPLTFSQAYNHACKLKANLPKPVLPTVAALQEISAFTNTQHNDLKLDAIGMQLQGVIQRLNKIEVTQTPSVPAIARQPQIICQLCSKTGHSAASCYSLQSRQFQAQSTANTNAPAQYTSQQFTEREKRGDKRSMECYYCHRLGHTIGECRKKRASDERQS